MESLATTSILRSMAYVGIFIWSCVFIEYIISLYLKLYPNLISVNTKYVTNSLSRMVIHSRLIGLNIILLAILFIFIYLFNPYNSISMLNLIIFIEICILIPSYTSVVTLKYLFEIMNGKFGGCFYKEHPVNINIDVDTLLSMSYLGIFMWSVVIIVYIIILLYNKYKQSKHAQSIHLNIDKSIADINRYVILFRANITLLSLLVIALFLLKDYRSCTYLLSLLLCLLLPGYFAVLEIIHILKIVKQQ